MLYPAELRGHSRQSGAPERTTGSDILARRASRQTVSTVRTERRAGHPLFARAAPSARHTR